MERRPRENPEAAATRREEQREKGAAFKRAQKMTEYGKQLFEKQRVKEAYGMREKQFRRFFGMALKSREATGEMLLSLLERRLDNVVYRLRMSHTRRQARQIVVHGHILVNGVKVSSPSYLVSVGDVVQVMPRSLESEIFLKQVIEKRANAQVKVPEWLEHDRKEHIGKVLRLPVRADIQLQVNENSIVELYSR
ncbi:MAG: 30S ribosomal protein S4 [Candidatus Babeliaceae bacterium]|nr:30S ribosomal protein S4 [Candidatus Babeliaceae bacterium]